MRFPAGELDLVMEDGPVIVFVEVRYRRREDFGGALESVDRRKQARLRRAAALYLQARPRQADRPCRFDVLALAPGSGGRLRVRWVRHAF